MQLQFTCYRCSSKGLTPDLSILAAIALVLGLQKIRCPECGEVLHNNSRQEPTGFRAPLAPAGLRVLVRQPSGPSERYSVCVVAEEDVEALLSLVLETNGFRVSRIPAGADPTTVIREGAPDLVVLDPTHRAASLILLAMKSDQGLRLQYSMLGGGKL